MSIDRNENETTAAIPMTAQPAYPNNTEWDN